MSCGTRKPCPTNRSVHTRLKRNSQQSPQTSSCRNTHTHTYTYTHTYTHTDRERGQQQVENLNLFTQNLANHLNMSLNRLEGVN